MRSLRVRITLAFFLAAFVVSGVVAGTTYVLARAYLTRQRTDAVVRQSFNTIRVAAEQHGRQEQPALESLASALGVRGSADVVLATPDRSVSSSVSIALDAIPPILVDEVRRGRVAYTFFGTDPRRVVFGSPLPHTDVEVFLVYPLRELQGTLALLARILGVVVAAGVLAGGGLGLRLAGETLLPLRRASQAARRVSEGLLDTRMEESSDELGALASSFNEMARALQERIARERRFVADASHELRTPLTALKASVEYLASQGLGGDLEATAALAAKEVSSLERLVDDLLELSRMEAGSVTLQQEHLDLSEFAREVVRRRAREDAVTVTVPADPIVVRTDKRRLERVVGNLLDNAIVHGGGAAELVVAVEKGQPSLSVIDRGRGIPAPLLPRVFERFWRGDDARRRSGGAGLGLAIAKENAQLLAAELSIISTEGRGTSATIVLPASAMLTGSES